MDEIEGLRAWLVVLGSFLIHLTALGNVYAFGVFVIPYEEEYGISRTEISVVYQLQFGLMFFIGLFSGRWADRFGTQKVMFAGCVFFGLGYLLASFATDFLIVILTQGVLVGIGNSLLYWPVVTVVAQWFDQRRGLALGIAVLGSGVGNFVVGIITESLISSLGTKSTLQIIGGVSTVFHLFATFITKRRLPNVTKNSFCSDADVLKDRPFQLLLLVAFFFQSGFVVPFSIVPAYVEDELGFTASEAAFVLSCIGIGSAIGRVTLGFVADSFGRILCFKLLVFATFVIVLVLYWCKSYAALITWAIGFGFASGGFIALVPVVVAEFYGVARLGGIMGYISVVMVPSIFIGPAVSSALQETRGSYDMSIIYTASVLGFSSFLLFLLKKKQEDSDTVHNGAKVENETAENDSSQEGSSAFVQV